MGITNGSVIRLDITSPGGVVKSFTCSEFEVIEAPGGKVISVKVVGHQPDEVLVMNAVRNLTALGSVVPVGVVGRLGSIMDDPEISSRGLSAGTVRGLLAGFKELGLLKIAVVRDRHSRNYRKVKSYVPIDFKGECFDEQQPAPSAENADRA